MATSDGRATNENKTVGRQIEKHRADQRNGEHVPEAWFDVEDSDGTVVEVKSTERRLAGGRRGRYQLVEDQHDNLRDHNGEYDFVLRDGDGAVAQRTMDAEDVEELRQEKDLKWPDGGKLKLPWSYVHDPDDVPGESAR